MSNLTSHVAFLRGINVGGHRVESSELVEVFESLGFDAVATFLASGNVIFIAKKQVDEEMRLAIEFALRDALGYEVPVIVRSADEVREIAAADPFSEDEILASNGKQQVIILLREPKLAAADEVKAMGNVNDRLIIEEKLVYWLPSNGVLKSDLDLSVVERLMGPTTMRTKNTIERIAKKFL